MSLNSFIRQRILMSPAGDVSDSGEFGAGLHDPDDSGESDDGEDPNLSAIEGFLGAGGEDADDDSDDADVDESGESLDTEGDGDDSAPEPSERMKAAIGGLAEMGIEVDGLEDEPEEDVVNLFLEALEARGGAGDGAGNERGGRGQGDPEGGKPKADASDAADFEFGEEQVKAFEERFKDEPQLKSLLQAFMKSTAVVKELQGRLGEVTTEFEKTRQREEEQRRRAENDRLFTQFEGLVDEIGREAEFGKRGERNRVQKARIGKIVPIVNAAMQAGKPLTRELVDMAMKLEFGDSKAKLKARAKRNLHTGGRKGGKTLTRAEADQADPQVLAAFKNVIQNGSRNRLTR